MFRKRTNFLTADLSSTSDLRCRGEVSFKSWVDGGFKLQIDLLHFRNNFEPECDLFIEGHNFGKVRVRKAFASFKHKDKHGPLKFAPEVGHRIQIRENNRVLYQGRFQAQDV